MNRSLLRLPLLGLLLVFAVSCGVEEYASPDPAPHTADQRVGEGRTPPPTLDAGVSMISPTSLNGGVTRWKYKEPYRLGITDGSPAPIWTECLITQNAHSVVLVRVLDEPVIDHTTCPSPYRDEWQSLHLQILDVIAGYPVPAELTVGGLTASHGPIHQGELYLLSLRRTEREWYPYLSLPIIDESSPGYEAAVTSERVSLPGELGALRAQLTDAFTHYDEAETCPGRAPWQSDEAFAAWIYAPGEHCAEPFVDPLQEP